MPFALSRFVNQPVLVSIPALFEDGAARAFVLLGVEAHGLWLQSDALTDRLLHEDGRRVAALDPAVFVPYAQIAGVVVATRMPAMPATEPLAEQAKARAAAKSRAATKSRAPGRPTASRGRQAPE